MNKMIKQAGDFSQWPTQVAAELSHHPIGVGSGDLGQAGQDQNVAVFESSLVHGLEIKSAMGEFLQVGHNRYSQQTFYTSHSSLQGNLTCFTLVFLWKQNENAHECDTKYIFLILKM